MFPTRVFIFFLHFNSRFKHSKKLETCDQINFASEQQSGKKERERMLHDNEHDDVTVILLSREACR